MPVVVVSAAAAVAATGTTSPAPDHPARPRDLEIVPADGLRVRRRTSDRSGARGGSSSR